MTGPQPFRDYPPIPSLSSRLLTVAADVALTCGIVALAYFFADWLASVVVAL